MRVIETCPECGADIVTVCVATYPPKETKRCLQCGWYWEEKDEDIVRVPFVPPDRHRFDDISVNQEIMFGDHNMGYADGGMISYNMCENNINKGDSRTNGD